MGTLGDTQDLAIFFLAAQIRQRYNDILGSIEALGDTQNLAFFLEGSPKPSHRLQLRQRPIHLQGLLPCAAKIFRYPHLSLRVHFLSHPLRLPVLMPSLDSPRIPVGRVIFVISSSSGPRLQDFSLQTTQR
jgi:hypothetical protein